MIWALSHALFNYSAAVFFKYLSPHTGVFASQLGSRYQCKAVQKIDSLGALPEAPRKPLSAASISSPSTSKQRLEHPDTLPASGTGSRHCNSLIPMEQKKLLGPDDRN